MATCLGCTGPYEPDAGDKDWCKACQYLYAYLNWHKLVKKVE
jgi:hypothetical protein